MAGSLIKGLWDLVCNKLVSCLGFFWRPRPPPALPNTIRPPPATTADDHKLGVIFPLRVVHISETLDSVQQEVGGGGICFRTPTAWSFHVISHTWSKGLRDLSDKIGTQLLTINTNADSLMIDNMQVSNSASSGLLYDLAFRHANLREEPCFSTLIKFLKLLAADGVEEVWIDAFCINQKDLTEKSREIAHMGDYYKNSKGCYVLTHGIDQGYDMWKKVGEMPRWFTRVWTLQELVLPEELFFTVTVLRPHIIAYINQCILKWGAPEVGFCNCVLSEVKSHWNEIAFGDHEGCPSDHIFSPKHQCSECGTLAIREVVSTTVFGLDHTVYFIERIAYLHLIFVDFASMKQSVEGELINVQEPLRLLHLQNLNEFFRPSTVIKEITDRQCSEDEDRVLSILGLLGVGGGTMQLRAGRSLREQIIVLATYLQKHNQDFLIEMMAMNEQGCNTMQGMSWAPDFRRALELHSPDIQVIQFLSPQRVVRSVEVVEVTQGAGKLRLQGAKVATVRISVGDISPITDFVRSSRNPFQLPASASVTLEAWGSQGFLMDIKLMREHDHELHHSGRITMTGSNKSILDNSTKTAFEFDASLVLLATHEIYADSNTDYEALSLVCLSKAGEGCTAIAASAGNHELHKIGLVTLSSFLSRLVFADSLPLVSCLLGGSPEESLEDAYFHCSSEEPTLKWVINSNPGVGTVVDEGRNQAK